MLATGLRALQLGLAGLGLYLLSTAVSPLVGASPSPRLELPDVSASPAEETGAGRYAVISERNLFKTRDQPLDTALVEEPAAETRLSVRLLGTTVARVPEFSVASVEDLGRRETLALRIDDEVAGARIARIERRRIVLDNKGVLEWLTLEDEEPSAPVARAEPPAERAESRTLNAAGGASRDPSGAVSTAERVARAARGSSPSRASRGGGAGGAAGAAGAASGGADRATPRPEDSMFRGDPQIVESDPDNPPAVRDHSHDSPINPAPIHGIESALQAIVGTNGLPLLPGETIVAVNGRNVSTPGGRESAIQEFRSTGSAALSVTGADGSTRTVNLFLAVGGPRR